MSYQHDSLYFSRSRITFVESTQFTVHICFNACKLIGRSYKKMFGCPIECYHVESFGAHCKRFICDNGFRLVFKLIVWIVEKQRYFFSNWTYKSTLCSLDEWISTALQFHERSGLNEFIKMCFVFVQQHDIKIQCDFISFKCVSNEYGIPL